MKTLVTGGAGFIGSHLTDLLLKEGHSVVVLDNFRTGRLENLKTAQEQTLPGKLQIERFDVADFEEIEPFFRGIDWVFHIAGLADVVPSIEQPLDYHRANVQGTVSVLEAARKHRVARFLYAASSSCYGVPNDYPTGEEAVLQPQHPYALTKALGESLILHWGKVYRLPVISLRLFNVYGPRSRTSGAYGAVLGVFLSQLIHNHPLTIVGDGTQKRDFVFVADVAKAFLLAAKSRLAGEVFNVGSGNPVSINRLAELLRREKIYLPKRPGEPDITHADIQKIKNQLGWEPRVSIEEGVGIMLKNLDHWKEAPLWTPEKIAKATKLWFKYLG